MLLKTARRVSCCGLVPAKNQYFPYECVMRATRNADGNADG